VFARLCNHVTHTYEINSTQGLALQATVSGLARQDAAIDACVALAARGAEPLAAPVHCPEYTGLLTSAAERQREKEAS